MSGNATEDKSMICSRSRVSLHCVTHTTVTTLFVVLCVGMCSQVEMRGLFTVQSSFLLEDLLLCSRGFAAQSSKSDVRIIL